MSRSFFRIRPHAPIVTYVLIALCVLIPPLNMSRLPFASDVLQHMVFSPALGFLQPYRFLTTSFVHANYMHLGMNMLALYIAGRPLEHSLGRVRYLALYIVSALAGSVGVFSYTSLFNPTAASGITVGASGAIFGLFISMFFVQRHIGMESTGLLILIVLNLFAGFVMNGVSWQAHLGGLVMGGLSTWGLTQVARYSRIIRSRAFSRGGAARAHSIGKRWDRLASSAVIILALLIEWGIVSVGSLSLGWLHF